MTHTPGPWAVGMKSGHNVATVFANDDDTSIAGVYGLPLNTRTDEPIVAERFATALANARLIAAAPDLYHALVNLLAAAEKHIFSTECQAQRHAARAAIAYAERGA